MRKSHLIASSVCIFSVAIGWQLLNPPAPFLLYNATESAPIGWYALDKKQQFKTGDQVAAFAPVWATSLADKRSYVPAHVPLLKTVWAVAGDQVCRKDGIVTVSNNLNLEAQPHDRVGRSMPVWSGCVTLEKGFVFLVSTDVQTSWDSRYFGPVSVHTVLGKVTFLGSLSGAWGWARGQSKAAGLDGKIKGGGDPLRVTPCLHISFRGAPSEGGSTPNYPNCQGNAAEKGGTPYSESPAMSLKAP